MKTDTAATDYLLLFGPRPSIACKVANCVTITRGI